MIKFFRNIRQKLFSENNPALPAGRLRRYFLYAIGEIILVVIGILIALALNNWNEQRKAENEIAELINRLEKDLLYNFKDATQSLNFYANQEKICNDVLLDKLDIEDYRNNNLISIVSANWDLPHPKSENLDDLIKNQKSAPDLYKPIISAAKVLKDRESVMESNWDRLNKTIQENIEKLTNEVSMIRLDSLSKQKKFKYMLTSEEYKKIIEMYWIHAQDYSDQVSRYRAQGMTTLSYIKVIIDHYEIEELKKLYKSHGMNSFIEVSCTDNLPDPVSNQFRRAYLIGNMSSEEVTLKVHNNNNVTGTYTLPPMNFGYTRAQYAGIGGDYTVFVERLDNNGACLEKYSSTKKGFLIIE